MPALFFLLLLLIPANSALAAKVERKDLVIHGVVVDRSGKPISGARVVVTGDVETNTISGSDGRFAVTLPIGTVAEVRQRPLRFELDARSRGKSLRVFTGAPRLELVVRGTTGTPVEGLEVVANVPDLGAAATRTLQTPKQSNVPFEVTFTSGRGRVASAGNLAAAIPGAPPAPAPVPARPPQDPRVRAADSLLDFREPPPAGARPTASAVRTEPIPRVLSAVPKTGTGTAPSPGAGATRTPAPAPAIAATRTPAPPAPTPTQVRAQARTQAPAPTTPPTPGRILPAVSADTLPAGAAARDARRTGREPPTAIEMLESARRRGTILAGEAERDSLRDIDRERRSKTRDTDRGAMRSGGNAAVPAGDGRRAADLLTASRRVRASDTEFNQAVAREKALASKRERDSLEAVNAAGEQQRLAAERARRFEDSARIALRRDSALAAMRHRDSLATLQRAFVRLREQERQDSLRALRAGPRLDRRIPVAGRAARVEEPSGDRQPERPDNGCFCNVEGTIEVRSNRPLSAPFGVTVTVRGRPSLRDRVLLFMGAPREFVIGRVPCGTRYLDVLPEPGRHYFVERTGMLGPFDCESGTLRQIRIVLVPR